MSDFAWKLPKAQVVRAWQEAPADLWSIPVRGWLDVCLKALTETILLSVGTTSTAASVSLKEIPDTLRPLVVTRLETHMKALEYETVYTEESREFIAVWSSSPPLRKP